MPGLSASELAPEALRAGEVIEYFSEAFVFGNAMGHRRAIVTGVDGEEGLRFPIDVDTGEPIKTTTMIKRVADRFGNPLTTMWRKLRTYRLVTGTFEVETRAGRLNKGLKKAVAAAYEAVRAGRPDVRDEIVPETPQSSVCSSPDRVSGLDDVPAASASGSPTSPPAHGGGASPTYSAGDGSEGSLERSSVRETHDPVSESEDVAEPSAPGSPTSPPADSEEASPTSTPSAAREESFVRSSVVEIVDLVSSQESQEQQVAAGGDLPSSVSEEKAAAYMRAMPNRHARAKIRHQPKKKRVQWHVPRSRKRRHLAKCAITRSGSVIHHAKAFKPAKIDVLLKSPDIVRELKKLHALRGSYQDPSSKKVRVECRAVQWPAEVEKISSCRRNGVKFPDIGSFDPCRCFGDCFWDTCSNVASASYCTPKYCKLGAMCSNAPRSLDTLKLYDTGRVGLGVYTTTDLDVGDVIGEYCGELTEFAAVVEGQPAQALKHNSGFTMLYNAKSVKGNYVYVDAVRCGSITRFLSHACQPNAAFVEQQTRSRVRVLVKMIKKVNAGAQITVHYGNERWFKCACDRCWNRRTEEDSCSDDE